MTKILTHFENPPIPDRRFDWCAFRYGCEPEEPIGYGSTPEDAIQNLHEEEERLLDMQDECLEADLAYAMEANQ